MLKKILYLMTCSYLFFTSSLISKEESHPLLIVDMNNEALLPPNFRTTKDPFKLTASSYPSREGLDTLQLSGSGQFSEESLKTMLKHLHHPAHLCIVDLRQESHGFLNGVAVSWYGIRNWANSGKSLNSIEQEEHQLLKHLLQQKEIQVAHLLERNIDGQQLPPTEHKPFTVQHSMNEHQLSKAYQLNYVRIPVTDHSKPSPESVDAFISLVRQLPDDYWLHVHCAGGAGRTTTFMAMYDMMKNAKQISCDTILERQWFLGNYNLKNAKEGSWKTTCFKERLEFLKDFYEYCHFNQDQFATSWTTYLTQK